ncbi:hypothetical protein H0H92_014665, partial [Tricholoma furcatifolium]
CNPAVQYCQGMNLITSTLLLAHTDEKRRSGSSPRSSSRSSQTISLYCPLSLPRVSSITCRNNYPSSTRTSRNSVSTCMRYLSRGSFRCLRIVFLLRRSSAWHSVSCGATKRSSSSTSRFLECMWPWKTCPRGTGKRTSFF